jgi:hypothetical protein
MNEICEKCGLPNHENHNCVWFVPFDDAPPLAASDPTGYRVAVKNMHEWAAWGADYYAYDLDNDTLSQDYFGMSEDEAYEEFDNEHQCRRDNVIITPIYVCSNDGKEIEGKPFKVEGSNHFFCDKDCFYEHDAALMDKLRGKYS